MNTIITLLQQNPQVSDYKINVHKKESYELFFVKGKLETVRLTDTCDKEVTVYVDHGEFKGDSQFFVYPSTDETQVAELIKEAVDKALLINNKYYDLPAAEQGEYEVESNFAEYEAAELAAKIAQGVFGANQVENASLNSVEIFINKHVETIANSKGLNKTQVRYDAMVEAIPTFNGPEQSVELYEQYNFSNLEEEDLAAEIAGKMAEVKARYEAVKPETIPVCPVILNKEELSGLFARIAMNLNYSSVYSHSNLFHKGDMVQKAPKGDFISITMTGEAKGCVSSTKFDSDGLSLGSVEVVRDGQVVNYHGSNRFGQYLGEKPTGGMTCMNVAPGTVPEKEFAAGPYLEVISMSGLQVDFYNDYIGGEVRLAYYHDGEKITPVTGISISGKLGEVLDSIRLSKEVSAYNGYAGYHGPEKAILTGMAIF